MILLLITMISCVCAGTLVVKVKQTHYQAEENDNITLEWTFTTRSNKSPNLVLITCDRSTNKRGPTVLHLEYGVEVSELQDEQFSGRVQWDRNVLREGRFRLNVSRLRTNDSGHYKCEVQTRYGQDADHCWLNVTASVAQELQPTPTVNPDIQGQKRPYITRSGGIIFQVMTAVIIYQRAAVGVKVYIVLTTVVTLVLYVIRLATVLSSETEVLSSLWGVLKILAVFAALLIPCRRPYLGAALILAAFFDLLNF